MEGNPVSVITRRSGALIFSSISAIRSDLQDAQQKADDLLESSNKLEREGADSSEIWKLRFEREYYTSLFMTVKEQEALKQAVIENGLDPLVFAVLGSGFVFKDSTTIMDIPNPVKALQRAIDIHEGVVNFRGAVEILYHSTYESSWLIINDSIVREESSDIDVSKALEVKTP